MDEKNNNQLTDVIIEAQEPAQEQATPPQDGTVPPAQENQTRGNENTLLGGSAQKPADIPQKPGDGTKSGGENEANEAQPPDYSFKLPEGFSFAEGQQDAYASLARELKLAPDAAQKVLDYGAEQIKTALNRQEEAGNAEFDKTVADWGEETKKRLGGADGTEWPKNLAEAKRAMDVFATEGFKKLLDSRALGGFGLGNHPEVVQTFLNIAKEVQTDTYVARHKSGGKADLSDEEIMYPHQVPQK